MAGEQDNLRSMAAIRDVSHLNPQQPANYAPPPGLAQRLIGSAKGFIQGWMDPGLPIPTSAPQDTPPRMFDYPVAYNVNIAPRTGALNSFETLLQIADAWDILRGVIEKRKNQLVKLQWDIKPIDPEDDGKDSSIAAIKAILKFPDGVNDWSTWLRACLEQWFVIDALTIEPVYKPNGDIYGFYGIHGATIQVKIDEQGRVPLPPNVAYQQVIKGVPAVNFTRDQLIYKPQNVRFNKIFGFSRVEQILLTANIGLRRQNKQLLEFTSGTLPEAMMAVPDGWTPAQIREFQDYFDSRFSGNTARRAALTFMPHGSTAIPYKQDPFKNELDEWLARICCFFFNMEPNAFIKQMNRATADNAKETAAADGTEADMGYVKTVADLMIQKYCGRPDLEFVFAEGSQVNPQEQMEVETGYVKVGIYGVDEIRQSHGLEPIGMGPAIYTATGAVLIKDIVSGAVPIPGTTPKLLGPNGEPVDLNNLDPKNPKAKDPKKPDDPNEPPNKKLGKAGKTARREVKRLPLPGKFALVKGMKIAVNRVLKRHQEDATEFIWSRIAKKCAEAGKAEDDDNDTTASDVSGALDLAWFSELPAVIKPFLTTATKASVRGAIAQIVDDKDKLSDLLDQGDEAAIAWAEEHSAEMVGMKFVDGELVDNPDAAYSLSDATRNMLQSDISQALKDGWTRDDLAKEIATGPFSMARAENIAQTELAYAHAQGTMAGWRATGEVESKKSLLSNDHNDVDECDDNAEQGEIGIDEDFDSGDDTAPFHPRCECDVVAVLKPLDGSEAEEDE